MAVTLCHATVTKYQTLDKKSFIENLHTYYQHAYKQKITLNSKFNLFNVIQNGLQVTYRQ